LFVVPLQAPQMGSDLINENFLYVQYSVGVCLEMHRIVWVWKHDDLFFWCSEINA